MGENAGENSAPIREYLREYGYEKFEQFLFDNIKAFDKTNANPNKKNIVNRIKVFMTNLRTEVKKINSKGRGQETPFSVPQSADERYIPPANASAKELDEDLKRAYMERFGYSMDSS
jgi:hypothetical protein